MATLRTVMNRALGLLGEDTIPSGTTVLTGVYPLKVLEMLNQFKEEIEDSHNWRALRRLVDVTVPAATGLVDMTTVNERSRLARDPSQEDGTSYPLVYDITTTTATYPLEEMSLPRMLRNKLADASATATQADSFALGAGASNPILYTWPVPAGARNYRLAMIVPQATLATTDLDTHILVPTTPLLQGLLWFALTERGEELGQSSMFTEERYRNALDAAISRDNAEQGEMVLVPT